MIKCKEFVHTVSHDLEQSWQKKWQMRFHLFICVHCRRYVEHLKIIKSSIKDYYRVKNKENHTDTVKKIEDRAIEDLFKK